MRRQRDSRLVCNSVTRRYDPQMMAKSKPPTRGTEGKETVQLGVRIPRSLHFALKTACLHQERDGKQPQRQADIVAEAIQQWLRDNGHCR